MPVRVSVLALAALLLVPLVPLPGEASSHVFQAGAAKADITPPVTTPLWAYTARHAALAIGSDLQSGRTYPRFVDQRDDGVHSEAYAKTFMASEGIHTRLYAHAFVLDDGDGVLAIVLADLGGVPGELHQAVVDRLAAAGVPVPRERLLLGSTHTHGGPGGIFQAQGYALLGGDAFDPRVFGLVADQIAKAVADAYAKREPATLAIGSATIPDASRNRATAAHLTGHAHDGDHVKRAARILRLDAVDGRPIGAIVNFAAHGTIVGDKDLLFTADNQGIASRLVARSIAADAGVGEHDVVVAWLNGAQGDVSPIGSGSGFFERVEDAGRRQAPHVLDGWRALAGAGTTDVRLDARFQFLCFCGQDVDGERISPIPILGVGEEQTFPAPLGVPGHGGKIPLLVGVPGAMVPNVVRLQVARVNGYVMVAMPGEASVALGESIESAVASFGTPSSPVTAVDVVGLANDYVSYMSTLGEYDHQSYEGSFNLYGRMTGPLFRRELVGLAAAMLAGAPAPGSDVEAVHPPVPTPPAAPLLPSAPPAAVAEPAAVVARGSVARFTWTGGAPGVDAPPDHVLVRLVDASTGASVHDDRGFEIVVRYAKIGADGHRWTAEWTPRAGDDGSYRFLVDGRHVAAPGATAAYALASAPFAVPPGQ